jgi:hypothetical protein
MDNTNDIQDSNYLKLKLLGFTGYFNAIYADIYKNMSSAIELLKNNGLKIEKFLIYPAVELYSNVEVSVTDKNNNFQATFCLFFNYPKHLEVTINGSPTIYYNTTYDGGFIHTIITAEYKKWKEDVRLS